MPDTQPLTDEERQQLAELSYRQAMDDWRARETYRQAQLAAMAPIAASLAPLDDILTSLRVARGDLPEEDQRRADRLLQILSFDGKALLNRAAALSTPAPEPQAPETVGEEDTEPA